MHRPGQETAAHTFRAFGRVVQADVEVADAAPAPRAMPDLFLSRADCEPVLPRDAEWRYASPFRDVHGEPVAQVVRAGEEAVIRCGPALSFGAAGDQVRWWRQAGCPAHLLGMRFLSSVMAYVLERDEVAVLHGSAVMVGGRAVGFLAAQTGGKTTLAAALVQAGHALLTDDMLATRVADGAVTAAAGCPVMRMSPATAERFVPGAGALEELYPGAGKLRVPVGRGFGGFAGEAAKLAALYVPQRRAADGGGEIRIRVLTAQEAVVALVRESFAGRLVAAMGWAPRRLAMLAQLAQLVPVKELSYPEGLDLQPEVCAAVVADAAAGAAASGRASD